MGADHGLKLAQADSDFDYRIVFATSQGKTQTTMWGSGGQMNSSQATTAVYDAKGTKLFEFQRGSRWTDSGAANAAAKEIIKRILRLRKLNAARKP